MQNHARSDAIVTPGGKQREGRGRPGRRRRRFNKVRTLLIPKPAARNRGEGNKANNSRSHATVLLRSPPPRFPQLETRRLPFSRETRHSYSLYDNIKLPHTHYVPTSSSIQGSEKTTPNTHAHNVNPLRIYLPNKLYVPQEEGGMLAHRSA